jgi:hypothetical protein
MKQHQNLFEEGDSFNESVMKLLMKILEMLEGTARSTKQAMDDYIDEKTVARKLNRSTRTLYGWRSNGVLPFRKIGRTIYYKVADVEKLFDINIKKK